MSNAGSIVPVTPEPTQNTASVQPSASNPTTAGAIASSGNSGTAASTVLTTGSMEALKEQAPDVYKKILEGIAQKICSESARAEDKRKRIALEYQT